MTNWIAPLSAWLVDYYVLASVLLASALFAMGVVQQPARRKCLAWWATFGLIGLAVAPALPYWPRIALVTAEREVAAESPQSAPTVPSVLRQATFSLSEADGYDATNFTPTVTPLAPRRVAAPTITARADNMTAPMNSATRMPPWPFLFVLGGLAMGLWLSWGAIQAARICRMGRRAPAHVWGVLSQLVGEANNAPRILVSPAIASPVALCVLNPTIVLPEEFARQEHERSMRAAVAHEWAHIQGGDLWLLAIGRLLLVILYAHPLYWWFRKRIGEDQELLADVAAANCSNRHDYAADLCNMARQFAAERLRRRPSAALAIWERPTRLSRRVARLLDETEPLDARATRRWALSSLALSALSWLACSMVTFQPADVATAAQTELAPSQSQNDKAAETHSTVIAGKCVDESDRPLAGVRVALYLVDLQADSQTLLQETLSEEDGAYTFRDVPRQERIDGGFEHRYMIIAHLKDRASSMTSFYEVRPSHDFAMAPAVEARGTVTDSEGNPIQDALARFDFWLPVPLEGFRSARTDAQGRFEFADMAAYDVKDHIRDLGGGVSERPAPRFRVEHADFAPTWVPYDKIPFDVDVVMEPGATIAGRVVFAPDDRPAAGVEVRCQSVNRSTSHWATAMTDADGNYKFTSLPAGAYNLWSEQDEWTIRALDSVAVARGEEHEAADLRFIKGGIVRGKLLDARTRQPVRLKPGETTQIGLHGPSRPRSGAAVDSASVGADGSFTIRVAPGENYLYFMNTGPWEVLEPNSHTIDVADAAATVEIEFFVTRANPATDEELAQRRELEEWKEQWEREKPAIAAITELGGWFVTEPRGLYETVVEVNMVYHEDENNGRLDNNQVTDEALSYVRKFQNLQRLLLKETQATDDALAHVRGMEHLERIYLWDASLVTDEGVAHLATLPSLKYIHLNNSQITDKAIEHLASAPKLWLQMEGLSLQKNALTDQALEHLARFVNLKSLWLDLGQTSITDAGLRHVQGLKSLETLGLQHTQITDEGLEYLHGLSHLKQLYIEGTKATDAGVAKLKESLPDLQVEF